MPGSSDPAHAADIRIPAVPVLIAAAGRAHLLTADGAVDVLAPDDLSAHLGNTPPLVCHGPATARRLGLARFPAHDVLELFAFVRPAVFCLPTPLGLAQALGLKVPASLEQQALTLVAAAGALLGTLAQLDAKERRQCARLAMTMARAGWNWGPPALAALGGDMPATSHGAGLDVWKGLGEWSEHAPEPPPEDVPVSAEESRERLQTLLQAAPDDSEARPQQQTYAEQVAAAFGPRDSAGAPNMVLAEAGTGVGKTLGYIAPSSVWAEKNGGAVWISTFTKNLQRQIDQELDRLYPDPVDKRLKAVVRKGRENYLCLLNFEEAVARGTGRQGDVVALAIMARWIRASRDGDMIGGDFPSWLLTLFGASRLTELADRRGECIYSACDHYRKCFIEKSARRAKRAEIVIANHALVMIQAAIGAGDGDLPLRYVFDEGHHVFGAADGAFSAHLTGAEAAELRRWICGGEGRRSRARGLEKRIGDLASGDDKVTKAMQDSVAAARCLPGSGWLARISGGEGYGPCERFLAKVRQQTLARCNDPDSPYGLEAGTNDPVEGLLDVADKLSAALNALITPVKALIRLLAARLDDEAADLDTATRQRIEAAARGLQRRLDGALKPWSAMLQDLHEHTPAEFVDWYSLSRSDSRETDMGYHRHWVDPTLPLAKTLLANAHGVLMTSATLRDKNRLEQEGWEAADVRTGTNHLPLPPHRVSLPSPFDYAASTRILVVTDVRRDNVNQVSAAYRELMTASGGGALGLFTAIWRLRAVQKRILEPLEGAGIPVYSQHVDPLDTATLVDIFRAEEDSCLLGTDAVRDGVDVPGRALRLIVFDRVPWPRPDILHRARKAAFGKSAYDDMLTRLKLKQAYGRLIRRETDRGVFVMLDAMLPSRLTDAFPPEVAIERVGLADAVDIVGSFTGNAEPDVRGALKI